MGDRARVAGSSRGGTADAAGEQPWSQSAGRAPSRARRRPSPLTSANEQLREQGANCPLVTDMSGEGVPPDVVRVGAAAHAGVECVDGGHLLRCQREVEDVDVLDYAVRLDRLRDCA